MSRHELITILKPLLKERGYRKIRQNWYRDETELIIVFNIQNSYYDKDEFYINLGIIIKKLRESDSSISISNCHLQQRIDLEHKQDDLVLAEKYMRVISLWEQWYGELEALRTRALENKLPMICTPEARTFLTTVR